MADKKTAFYNKWDNQPPVEATPCGTRFIDTYQEEYNKDGELELVQKGKTNVYEMIQASVESTKIENLLHAVAMGDVNAMKQVDATYMDTTTMPKNLMEMENLVIKAKREFDEFPAEVKELFNNSADAYVMSMGTQEFFDKMSPYNDKIKAIEEAGTMKAYNAEVAKTAKFQADVEKAKGVTTSES